MNVHRIVGFSVLMMFVLILLVSTLWTLWAVQWQFLVIFVLIAIGCLYTFYLVFMSEVYQSVKTAIDRLALFNFIAVFAGALLTYVIHVHSPLGPVMASGMVGMLAALFIKPYQVPIYCGCFVGMSSPLLLGVLPFFAAAFLAGGVYVLAKDVLNGFGGKLGTIALSGALISSVLTGRAFLDGVTFTIVQQILIIGFSMLAAVVTYFYSVRLKQGPVLASSMVGFLGGAILPLVFGDFGVMLSIAVIGATYVGMSNTMRFEHEGPIVIAGIVFGLIFIYSAPYFGGAGGKLGTIALLSVLSIYGMRAGFNRIKPSQSEC